VHAPKPCRHGCSHRGKNFLFLGSDDGGTAAAVPYTVLASAKANQVEPFAYVRDALVQMSVHSPPAAEALLPYAWLTAYPEARRCWSRWRGCQLLQNRKPPI
jgi:transposase